MCRGLIVAVALLVMCGCSESELSLTVPQEQQGESQSALDAMTSSERDTYGASERELADLMIGPRALHGELRLAAFAVDDPNGTGRIDGRWYPPRVVIDESSSRVDSPPVPNVSAAFIPGNPAQQFGTQNELEAQRDLLEAPSNLGISIYVLDNSEQRDQLSAVMLDSYDGGEGENPLAKTLFGDPQRSEAYPTGYPGSAMELEVFGTATTINQYEIGERIILEVGVSAGGLLSGETGEPDLELAQRAIDAQVKRLQQLGYG